MKNLVVVLLFLIAPFSCFSSYIDLDGELYRDDERAEFLRPKFDDDCLYHFGFIEEVLFTCDLLKQTNDTNEKKILKSRIKVLLLWYVATLKRAVENAENDIAIATKEQEETTSSDKFYQNHLYILGKRKTQETCLKTIQNVQTFLNSVLAGR